MGLIKGRTGQDTMEEFGRYRITREKINFITVATHIKTPCPSEICGPRTSTRHAGTNWKQNTDQIVTSESKTPRYRLLSDNDNNNNNNNNNNNSNKNNNKIILRTEAWGSDGKWKLQNTVRFHSPVWPEKWGKTRQKKSEARSDIVFIDKKEREVVIIDVAIPGDDRVKDKASFTLASFRWQVPLSKKTCWLYTLTSSPWQVFPWQVFLGSVNGKYDKFSLTSALDK